MSKKENILAKRKSTLRLGSQKILSNVIVPLKNEVYEEFINLLSVQKIHELSKKCKEKELEFKCGPRKSLRLKRSQFIPILRQIFPSQNDSFPILFDQIFIRFKSYKCEVRCQSHKMENYFINKIVPEEEIDVYEIACALACFIKCDVKDKFKLLFDITDSDDDGFVNQNEVKKMVYTINYLFSNEETPIQMESTVLHQSLSSIRAQQAYKMIMKVPGELSKLFAEERFVNFEQFFSAVEKIPNYKFIIFPLFVNFKKCLLTVKKEKDFEVNMKNYGDFSKILNEIISGVKANNDIGITYTDFKKSLEPINVENKTSHFLRLKSTKSKAYRDYVSSIAKKNISKKKTLFVNDTTPPKIKEDLYEINYNKICGLETYPGKININDKYKGDSNYMNLTTASSFKDVLGLRKNVSNLLSLGPKKNIGPSYMTFSEIMAEIQMLVNKHKTDEQSNDELIKLSSKINHLAHSSRTRLKDPNPFSNLTFGKVEYNKNNKIP